MRRVVGAFSIVLLLIVNLSGSLFIFQEKERLDLGQEYVLQLDRAWNSDDWSKLYQYGISPLRQLTFDELLVWLPDESRVPHWALGYPAGIGEWRGDVGALTSNGVELVVVLEPRLPNEVASAVDKAKNAAKKRIFKSPLIKGTIPHRLDIKFGSVKLMLKPASAGTGIIAGATVRAMMEQVGITDILTKNTGSTNPVNVVKAVEHGLKSLRDPLIVSRQRGITLDELFN